MAHLGGGEKTFDGDCLIRCLISNREGRNAWLGYEGSATDLTGSTGTWMDGSSVAYNPDTVGTLSGSGCLSFKKDMNGELRLGDCETNRQPLCKIGMNGIRRMC